MAEPSDVAEEWEVVDSEVLADTGWVVTLRADRVRRPGRPDDEPFRRFVLEHPGSAVVLAVDKDERVLCVTQYRHALRARLVELPAGLLDNEGESSLDAARRELQEETGMTADTWTHLLTSAASSGISTEKNFFFMARDLRQLGRGGFVPQAEEADIAVEWFTVDQLLTASHSGAVQSAQLVLALNAAIQRGLLPRPAFSTQTREG